VRVNKLLGLALGILAAIGGFVDIGDLVFNVAAGATFGYQLLWVLPIGVVGIIVYSEMCGRVAAVSKKAVFDAVRERVGFKAGLGALVASEIVNLMTLAAELGGVAIALQLLSGLPYLWLVVLAVVGLGIVIWVTAFEWIERIFGYGGLCMLVFAVAAVKLGPDWTMVAKGFIPHVSQNNSVLYAYFVIGLLGAAMTPYEVYFYSSGGVEEEWTPKDIGLNRANAIVGYGLGGTLSVALMIVGATIFLGHGISPEHLGTIALGPQAALGQIGLLLALVGILFAVGGASIDTVFSGAYNLAQFCGWEWGRYRTNARAPRFTITWAVLLVLGAAIVMTGVDPVVLTEYAVIFSVVALPLTYVPILLVANDDEYMGRYRNGRLANVLGIVYLFVIMIVALAAIPLMILTNGGQN
jgi:Mn2+/Fe2+ NRAMP family transporter